MKAILKSCVLILLFVITTKTYAAEHIDNIEFINDKREYIKQAIKENKDIKALTIALFSDKGVNSI
ncbi:MAG: hypothetical protein R6V04_02835 [bacterium]